VPLLNFQRIRKIRVGVTDQATRGESISPLKEVAMLRVGLIVPAGFSAMSCATLATFDTANFTAGEHFYDISVLSEHGGPVPNSFGTATETEPLDVRRFDTLLVAACPVPTPATPKLLEFLRQSVADVRRVGSICSGTFALAEAGILDGRRATTHWVWAQELERRFPKVRVEIDRIFIADGPVWTSAGMTAGIDMALGLVERDMGRDAARATAKMMVVHHRRAGGQSQHSVLLGIDAKSDRVQNALTFARNNLRQPLTVEQLAEAARLSPRQFTRVFRAETGQSPARAVENLLRPPDICSSREGCQSRKSPRKQALATVSGCGEASCAPLDKRLRPCATPPIHLPPYRRTMGAGILI
jgi:transcriptional regulator GlxA family with amidase domain